MMEMKDKPILADGDWMKPYEDCRLCPRACGVDRVHGQLGFCGASADLQVGRAALHAWEEPPISGGCGSGTVFFSHCTLGCVFCQNRAISRRAAGGVMIDAERLAEVFLELQAQGAHNINLVTAVHYAPHLQKAIPMARQAGLYIPVLLNSGGYEAIETLDALDGLIDIYLLLSITVLIMHSAIREQPIILRLRIRRSGKWCSRLVRRNTMPMASCNGVR